MVWTWRCEAADYGADNGHEADGVVSERADGCVTRAAA
jgi:hypothetical protein